MRTKVNSGEEKKNRIQETSLCVWLCVHLVWYICCYRESYVHVITEHRSRSILQPALMGSVVQNPRKHQAQRQLILHRGIIKAPAPATTMRGGRTGWRVQTTEKKGKKVSLVYRGPFVTYTRTMPFCYMFISKL